MSPELVLFLLRLLSAVFLLAFLGTIAWLIHKDISLTTSLISKRDRHIGSLRVIASELPDAPENDYLIPLLPVTRIGRAANNTIALDDEYVSSQHALVTLQGDQWWLEDLHSRNGTVLNDLPIGDVTVVATGDVITIGRTKFRVELGDT
jgi:hypothetical protein